MPDGTYNFVSPYNEHIIISVKGEHLKFSMPTTKFKETVDLYLCTEDGIPRYRTNLIEGDMTFDRIVIFFDNECKATITLPDGPASNFVNISPDCN